MQNSEKSSIYFMPRITLIGIDSLKKLGEEVTKLKLKKVLVITDKFMSQSPIIASVKDIVTAAGIEIQVYDGVEPNPTVSQVKEGIFIFMKENCDGLISLGGGSPHDCAKAVKLTALKTDIWKGKNIPLIAINTTAGTASEITRYAVITDDETHQKVPIVQTDVIPDIAVDDPMLMLNMPKGLTAATGMDALTHAIEAYVSKGSNHVTDCTAEKAVELVHKYLVRAYLNGQDIEARDGMVYAQYLAGMAFSNAGLGLVHAMAHQLGGLYNLPHGVCNALLLPYVMVFNQKKAYKLYAELARKLDLCSPVQGDEFASKALIRLVQELNKTLGISSSLKDLKVNFNDCGKLAEMAMKDVTIKSNPVEPTLQDVKKIYEDAHNGNLYAC